MEVNVRKCMLRLLGMVSCVQHYYFSSYITIDPRTITQSDGRNKSQINLAEFTLYNNTEVARS